MSPHEAEQAVALVVGPDAGSRAPIVSALRGQCAIHEAATGDAARVLLGAIQLHVIFVADVLPDGDGADLCAYAAERSPATACIVYGNPHDAERVVYAVNHGKARNYLTGAPPPERVRAALKDALAQFRACANDCRVVEQLRSENTALERRVEQRTHALVELNEQLREALEEVHTLSYRDDLTGLLNRRALHERLEKELCHSRRYRSPLSCLWCDIHDFSSVNEKAGHELGDTVLHAVADRLRENVRAADIPGRAGSDAFVIILPHTDGKQALTLAERLRHLLTETPYQFDVEGITIRLAFGIAAVEDEEKCAGNDLLNWASLAEREARATTGTCPIAIYSHNTGVNAFSC